MLSRTRSSRTIGSVQLRAYQPSDAVPTRTVFYRAVHETARADYTAQQLDAWAPPMTDYGSWNERMLRNRTVVAEEDDVLLGFGDADAAGYVDMMFVLPEAAGRGVAGALLDHVLGRAAAEGASSASTHASLTARGFFAHKGFVVVEERHSVRAGVELTNFLMTRSL